LFSVSVGIFAENIWEVEADTTQSTTDMSASPATDSEVTGFSPMSSQQDATYVIKKDDTLWDLAFQFLGNPFDWQKIWQINSYITNPDLIYPGNSLQIPGQSAEAGMGSVPENLIPSETFGAIDFNTASSVSENSELYPGDSQILTSLRRKQILSASQLSSAPFLWTEKDKNGMIFPGNGIIEPPKQGASYQIFTKIPISLFKDAKYSMGDTIDIYKSLQLIMFNNKLVNLVQRCGRAVVQKVAPNKMEALLYEMSDVISGNERIITKKKDLSLQIDTLIDPDAAISAEVFTRVEQTASPYPFQMIILNKGSTHGIQIGDIFTVYNKQTALLSVIGIIVHANAESSTLNMAYMRQNRIDDGDDAKLLRRAKFSEGTITDDGNTYFSGATAPH
jgi:LysM repeat protein